MKVSEEAAKEALRRNHEEPGAAAAPEAAMVEQLCGEVAALKEAAGKVCWHGVTRVVHW